MTQVVLPQLGESVVEGTVARWLVKPGDTVARDQAIVEVETDKASVEVPSPAAGVMARLAVAEGTTVPVGALLCEIEAPGGRAAPPARDEAPGAGTESFADAGAQATARPAEVAMVAAPPARAEAPERLRSSPLVRRLAREHGLDLSNVRGTGAGGRIRREDIEGLIARSPGPAPAPAPEPATPTPAPASGDEVVPWSRRRKIIAERMVASRRTAAHVFCVAEVDLHRVVAARGRLAVRPPYTAFVAAAAARALREPDGRPLNATVRGEATVLHGAVHLGVAVDAPEGLIVPVLRDADRLDVPALARAIAGAAERARAGKVTPDELTGGTFTISNPGPRGNLYGASIILQPQVAILRMGEIVKRPLVVDVDGADTIAIRPVMMLALSYDHRIVDGAVANACLRRVKDLLEAADLPGI